MMMLTQLFSGVILCELITTDVITIHWQCTVASCLTQLTLMQAV